MSNDASVSFLPRTVAATGSQGAILDATGASTITSTWAATPGNVTSAVGATTITSTWASSGLYLAGGVGASKITSTWAASAGLTISAVGATIITINASVPLWSTGGDGWSVNWDTGASAKYESFGFNSYAQAGSRYYGARADGIYLLGADDDNGTPIQASVDVGLQRFGSDDIDRLVMVYADMSSTDAMQLKVSYSDRKGAHEYIYGGQTDNNASRMQKFIVGRGIKATYIRLELFNLGGCDFTLNKVITLTDDVGRRA
jgi:hypothetical protein